MPSDFVLSGTAVSRGTRALINIPVAKLYTGTDMSIPVHVIRGKRAGPTLFISAAIHGDELNGIEIIRRLQLQETLNAIKGTLILVPMVNVFGVLNQSRYLPDRRDLNRCFPGSQKGSLAGRLANLFLTEIVQKCDYGIDLHTGAIHRSNLPQIRANLDDPQTKALAEAFGVPVLLNSNLRDGSLRQAADDSGVKILLYEAGEALRFDELCIRAGLRGVLDVMRHLGMIRKVKRKQKLEPFEARSSSWIRATESGIVRLLKNLGERVKQGEEIAKIYDPNGHRVETIYAKHEGIVIGRLNIPLVQEGDALMHVAMFTLASEVAEHVEIMHEIFED
ncbi:succinylglutamate desuccinylase/aspartoacylase family protein [Pseudoalteromonas tunicata]|uniref:Succinylglutamate desuccinylase/aspartoacylase n=1 Tax=Pseudoalteromonas tunicata D2 TaxID=87626 RepID=A4CBN5_9GAMM|nr:hypothetical protein PTUN_a1740 [Pseudoalteromonas tunicata]EAR27772.1 Succinylglutamate desuccinylase/aspartoacylase [Pseudoalteromonas tunicata D2]